MRKTTQTFTFNGHSIRVVLDQGEPWFVAKDVTGAMGYARPDVTIYQRFKDLAQMKVRTSVGMRRVAVLSEAQTIDFAEDSGASEAEDFENWLHTELLPALHSQPSNQTPAAKTPTVHGAGEINHPLQHAEEKSMPAISLFNFDGADVRIVDQNGNPWFVAKDVATILGYKETRRAISMHCKKGSKMDLQTERGVREVNIIPESDVYRLIMRSKLPAAERFEEWVTSEVLPSIRKTGSYTVDRQAYLREALYDVPSLQFLVHECTVKIQELQDEVAENQPKVDTYHRIADTSGSLCLTDAAKALQVSPGELIAWMSSNGWIYKRRSTGAWVGYQKHTNRGFMEHKVIEVNTANNGVAHIAGQVRVTPQGLNVISSLMNAKRRKGGNNDGIHP